MSTDKGFFLGLFIVCSIVIIANKKKITYVFSLNSFNVLKKDVLMMMIYTVVVIYEL